MYGITLFVAALLFFVFAPMLIYMLPVLCVAAAANSALRKKKMRHEEEMVQPRAPKHDAIDVEYIEHTADES